MKRHFYLCASIPLALAFWFADSVVHYFFFGETDFEAIPSDHTELWMRSTILILLVAFGFFADFHTNKIIKGQEEKNKVYTAMLGASNHILNNFLNNMSLFKMEAEDSEDFDKSALELFDQVIDDTSAQIKSLEGIQNPDQESIENIYKKK